MTPNFLTQKFFDQNYFDPKILFDPKNFFDQIFFLTQKYFLTQKFFDPRTFLTQKCFWPKTFFDPKLFLTQNFFWPKLFLTKNFIWTKIFWTKIFLDQNLKKKNHYFWQKFLDYIYNYKDSLTSNQMGFDIIEINLLIYLKIFWSKKLFCPSNFFTHKFS